jgi:RNA helicase armi
VGYNYLESDSCPENLIPYCVTANISNQDYQSNRISYNPHGSRSNISLHVLCHHRIIIGTCSSIGILYNMGCKPGHFTHIIIDEAGQPSEPEVMIPLSLAHINKTQIVLAGDPEQLGPINQSRLANFFGLSDSFLVRLLQQFPYQRDLVGFKSGYDPRLITKLLINYRSLPDLLDLPNRLFYENELIPQVQLHF